MSPAYTTGESLKNAALSHHEANRETVIRQAQRRLVAHLCEHGEGTADDARRGLTIPEGVNPKCLGAVPKALLKAGVIERAGYRTSVRQTAHARTLAIWRLVDPPKARAWLDSHPELSQVANAQGELPFNEKPGRANAPAND